MFNDYIDNLRSKGRMSFSIEDVTRDLKISINSAKSAVYRARAKGKLISPLKGSYVIVPPEHKHYGCIPAQELVPLIMERLKVDYYVGLLSAAMFYGATHQKPARFQIITNKRIHRSFVFGKVELEVIYKKDLANLPMKDFVVSSGYLKVATPELIIFDLFHYPRKSGGLSHIATVLAELIESVNPKKLIEIAQFKGEIFWLQRLGYILEQIDYIHNQEAKNIIDHLQKYLNNKSLRLVPLASNMSTDGFNSSNKWKIIENITIESDL